MIVFSGVTKRYGKKTVLDAFNLEIRPGEFLSIVGDSGVGKTTLLKLLTGMEHPSEGTILVQNKNLRHFTNKELQEHRRSLGCIFQDCKLLPNKTVFENVAFPLEACGLSLPKIMQLVPEALEAVGITHLQDSMPHEISGGESQRVGLARAIVHKPRLIIADEPTGNLDAHAAQEVLKNLIKIN